MLPRAVREAGERADAILAQINAGNTDESAPGEEQPVEQQAVEEQETPPVAAPASDDWEQKYRALAGKYSAEVPRYAEELRGLKAQVLELTERLAAPPQAEALPSKLTPAQVVEQFGEDFAEAVGAIAAQVADQRNGKLQKQVEAAQGLATQNARAQFMSDISKAVPDWQAIDQDPRFTAFLDEVDAMSGRSRRDFFADADARNDATRVAAFFTTFRGSIGPANPPASQNPALQAQLVPSSARTNDAPPGKKVYSTADIRNFYTQARKGLVSAQDYDRIESDIFAAQREGRLTA